MCLPLAARAHGAARPTNRPLGGSGKACPNLPQCKLQKNNGGARGCAATQANRAVGAAQGLFGASKLSRGRGGAAKACGGIPIEWACSEQYGQCSSTCIGVGAGADPLDSVAPMLTHFEPSALQTSTCPALPPTDRSCDRAGATDPSRIAKMAILLTIRRAVDFRCMRES